MVYSIHSRATKGFTLVELLIALGVLAIVSGMGVGSYRTLMQGKNHVANVQVVVQSLRSAQVHARAAYEDDAWGVLVASSGVTLFKGGSYSGRDASFDTAYAFQGQPTITGDTEIVFAKVFGTVPSVSTVTLDEYDRSDTITITTEGMVDFE